MQATVWKYKANLSTVALLVAFVVGSYAISAGAASVQFLDDFEDPAWSEENLKQGFLDEQDAIWSVVPELNWATMVTQNFDGPSDMGIVRYSPELAIVYLGGTNILANMYGGSGTISFELGLDLVSFKAVASGTFHATAYDGSWGELDAITLSSPYFVPVTLNGPEIRYLVISDGGIDVAIDDLDMYFASKVPPSNPENHILIGDEQAFPINQAVGLLDQGNVYLRQDLSFSFDMKLLGPDYLARSNLRGSGAFWLTEPGPGGDPYHSLDEAETAVAFELNPIDEALYLARGDQGVWTVLDAAPLPPDFDVLGWHHFEVWQDGDVATVVMDGSITASAAVGIDIAWGYVGFHNSESAAYDNTDLQGIKVSSACFVDDFEDASASRAAWYDGHGDSAGEFGVNNAVISDTANPGNSVLRVSPADGPSLGWASANYNEAADFGQLYLADDFVLRTSLRSAGVLSYTPTYHNDIGVGFGWSGVDALNPLRAYVAYINPTGDYVVLSKYIDGDETILLGVPWAIEEGVWYDLMVVSTATEIELWLATLGEPLALVGVVPHENNGHVIGAFTVGSDQNIIGEFDDYTLCGYEVMADVAREGVATGFTEIDVLSTFTVYDGIWSLQGVAPGDNALAGVADEVTGNGRILAKGGADYYTDQLAISAVVQSSETGVAPIFLDFDTPETGSDLESVGGMSFTDAGVVNVGPPFANVLANILGSPSFTIEFLSDVNSVSFDAIAFGQFNAEVRDVNGAWLDSISLTAPLGVPVTLNGPGIRSLSVSDSGVDAAIDNLLVDFLHVPAGDIGLFWAANATPAGVVEGAYYVDVQPRYAVDNVTLGKFVNDVDTALVDVTVPLASNTWYDLAVVMSNGVIQVWLDGVLLIEYDDSANVIASGGAGMYTQGQGFFDNFSLMAERVPIPGAVELHPRTLNLKSHGNYITCYIEIPGYDVADIDVSTVVLAGMIPAEAEPMAIGDEDKDGEPDLMVKFDRQQAIDLLGLTVGEQTLDVTWQMTDEMPFIGTDTIRVISPGKK